MIEAEDPELFGELMDEHEEAISLLLGMEKISTSRFHGIPGTVKSLGAWGGDFVMILSETGEKDLFDYLCGRDIDLIFRYDDLIYNRGEIQPENSW
jgi:hypothetical protein